MISHSFLVSIERPVAIPDFIHVDISGDISGDISKCPICRQDVARNSRFYRLFSDSNLQQTSQYEDESRTLLNTNDTSHQTFYGTVANEELSQWMMETDI